MRKTAAFMLAVLFLLTVQACHRDGGEGNETGLSTQATSETASSTKENETSESTTKTETTSGTYETTEDIYDISIFEPIYPPPVAGDPLEGSSENGYEVYFSIEGCDIIGYGDSIYLRKDGSYYLVWDTGMPVLQNCSVFATDLDGDAYDEIFIYDLGSKKTKVISYDPSGNSCYISLESGILNMSDLNDSADIELYYADRKEFPYKLYIYYYRDGIFLVQDVSRAAGREYSVISERRYIFAGTGDDISMYMLKDTELIETDASLYIASKNIFADSSDRLLTYDDLKTVSGYMLRYARNEIYARNGYIFDDPSLQRYFEDMPWYRADESFAESMLNGIEKENVMLIDGYLELAGNNVIKYDDMEAEMDIDGDGSKDRITLEFDGDDYTLKVNDATAEGTGDTLIEALYLFDIDKNDGKMEIGISEAGPSDDYATYIYSYDGTDIRIIGRIEGTGDSVTSIGDGDLVTYKRGRVLQTWFYTYVFRLGEDGMLSGAARDEYAMDTFVFVKIDLDVYDTEDEDMVTFVIKAGEPALIVSSDDETKCRIRNAAGEEGYFFIRDFHEINGTGNTGTDYFDGLSYAD